MIPVVVTLALLQATAATPSPDTAVLRVGTRTVTVFRGSLGAADPGERAAGAGRRLDNALADGDDSVTIRPVAEGLLVSVGGHAVFTVTVQDADTLTGRTLAAAAATAADQLREAVRETRESRDLRLLLLELGLALLATVAAFFAWRLLRAGRRQLRDLLEARMRAARPAIAVRGFTLVQPRQLLLAARVLVTALAWVVGLVLAYLYLVFVLSRFPWSRPWGQALGRFLLSTLGRLGLGALHAVPNLVTVVLIFLAARFLAGVVRSLFEAVERHRLVIPGLHPETAHPTRRIAIALLWLFAVIVAYPYLPGSGSEAFKGVSVFTGLLLTLGSAGLVGQAMSGLVLMYSRSFKVGDYIQAGGVQGTVTELGLLSTRLRTPKNEYVTLPNSVVVSGAVTDYSTARGTGHDEPLLIHSSVTIGYDVPWRRVHELLVTAAQHTDGVRPEPAPFVLQRALDDSYVEYQVNAPIERGRAAELPLLYSRLHAAIQDTFWAAGVEIMSPSYYAVRDGNTSTVPPEHRPKRPPGAFRVDVQPGG